MIDNTYFKNKIIWLIGASTGIGNKLTHELSKQDIKFLIISSRSEVNLKNLLEEVDKKYINKIIIKQLDASNKEEVFKVNQEILNDIGEVDTLIYNAGIYSISDYDNFNSEEYENQMKVNFFGSLYATEAVLPKMKFNKKGHIVVVSSVAGYRALPNAFGYGATKSAMTYFFESLRLNLEEIGIFVTTVHPGFVKTRLTDKNNFKMPFIMQADKAAEIIISGISNKKRDISFPLIFVLILKLLTFLPLSIYINVIKRIGVK